MWILMGMIVFKWCSVWVIKFLVFVCFDCWLYSYFVESVVEGGIFKKECWKLYKVVDFFYL